MKCFHIKLSVITVLIVMCSSAQALTIENVRVSDSAFNPANGETTDVWFKVDEPATVALLIYDGREVQIRSTSKALPAGENVLTWDGKGEAGNIVPNEAYHYVLRAKATSGEAQTYDLTDITGGERISAQNVVWNPEQRMISYSLKEPARVAIRIGLQDAGPLLRTLIDWVPRPAGRNKEAWDGWDASHVLDLSQHPKLHVFVDAYTVSDNTLLVGEPPRAVSFVELPLAERVERGKQDKAKKRMHYHPQQPLEDRGDVSIKVSLPEQSLRDEQGLPLVSGLAPIRLEVQPKDRKRVINRRFEPVFFVDGTFAFENEVGYLPFTWIWDASNTPDGIHYVTVNLRGYEGNFGVATLKVKVRSNSHGRVNEQAN